MALRKTFDHPFRPGTYDGYVWIAETNFNHAAKTGRIVLFVHESDEAAYAGYPPVRTLEINVMPAAQPAVYGSQPIVQEYAAAVYGYTVIEPEVPATFDEEGNVIDPGTPAVIETVLVTPEVPQILGDAPLLQASVPSFDELISSNVQHVTGLATSIYGLAMSLVQLKNAEVV